MMYAPIDADLMNPASWTKHPDPVFKADGANGVWAAGHNSFTTSPDGREPWILYHANSGPGQGCGGRRSPRFQPFTWSAEGFPVFGAPLAPAPLP
jgi:GH43 family beta-xylosidase